MRRRDSFDYYDARAEEVYDNDMYYYDEVREPRDRFNGTMEFTALKGHGGLDANSRPWGDETMMIERPQFGYPNQHMMNMGYYGGNQRPFYGQYPYYNTQQFNMNQPQPYGQNPFNTQSFSFNNNVPTYDNRQMQPNPCDLSGNQCVQQYGNTQQFDNSHNKKEEKKTLVEPHVIEKTIEIVKEPEGPNPFNSEETKSLLKASSEETKSLLKASSDETRSLLKASSEETRSLLKASSEETRSLLKANSAEARNLIYAKNNETKTILKENFEKQNEINKASYAKQVENEQKTVDLQKQVNELTQTFEKVKYSNEVNNEEAKNLVVKTNSETKNLLKENFDKQNEINKETYEKQMENAQKTAELQRQVDDLTQSFERVTKFGNDVNNEESRRLLRANSETKNLLKEGFDKQNEINKTAYEKQLENARKTAELQRQVSDLTQGFERVVRFGSDFNNEEAKRFLKANSETKNLLKEGFDKQNEINRAAYNKQIENDRKTAELQRQIDDLTQTIESVRFGSKTSNFEESKKLLKANSETKNLLRESFDKQNEINRETYAKQLENAQKTAELQRQVNELIEKARFSRSNNSNEEAKRLLRESFDKQNEINRATYNKQMENAQKTADLQRQVNELIEKARTGNGVANQEEAKRLLRENFEKQNEINKASYAKQLENEQKAADLQRQVNELIEKAKFSNNASSNEEAKRLLRENFEKQNEINKASYAKQLENEQKTADLQKQLNELTQSFERVVKLGSNVNSEEARNILRANNDTKSLLKESFDKQNEINKATYNKQLENAQKTAELQKQVDELTQTIANVTNNFGKAVSNISNNLKSTQEMLRNQTQEFEVKSDSLENGDVIIKSSTVKKNEPVNNVSSNTSTHAIDVNNTRTHTISSNAINDSIIDDDDDDDDNGVVDIVNANNTNTISAANAVNTNTGTITSNVSKENRIAQNETIEQPVRISPTMEHNLNGKTNQFDATRSFNVDTKENNLRYLDDEPYSTSEFDTDSINPVKLKEKKQSKKRGKRAAKEAKAQLRQQRKEEKRRRH